ncbi:MAG: hypothetical protein AAGK37_06000 [Pseudomonadota bacterium]
MTFPRQESPGRSKQACLGLLAIVWVISSTLVSAVSATAQDSTGEVIRLPSFAGNSVSLTMPEGWTVDALLERAQRYDEAIGYLDPLDKITLAVRRADHVHQREYDWVEIQIFPMNVSIQDPDSARGIGTSASSLDPIIDPQIAFWGNDTKFDFEADFEADLPKVQKTALFDDGTIRGERCAVYQPAERVLVRSCFNASSPDRAPFDVVAPLFDGMLNSIGVTPTNDAETPPHRFYHVPETVVTGGESYLYAALTLGLPSDWQFETLKRAHSAEAAIGGGVIVTGYSDTSFSAQVTLQVDGLPYKTRIGPEEFLASYKAVVDAALVDPQEVETPEDVTLPTGFRGEDFCLSRYKTRRFSFSDKVEVRTFLGKDAYTGDDVKMRVYTAGGITMICNLTLQAKVGEFDERAEEFETILKWLKVYANGTITLK